MTNFSELLDEIRAMREEGIPNLDDIEGKVIGICTTCKHRDNCAYLSNSTEAVYHCEEFDTQVATPVNATPRIATKPEEIEEGIQYKGLCKNCEKRMTCSYTKPEGGIWHCEEYE
jgi:hypothetical protein